MISEQLIIFSIITSVTPGPNNMMLLASGVNFGLRRTIPHMLGIAVGFTLMLLIIGSGLGVFVLAVPIVHLILKILSGVFITYLAWSMAMTSSLASTNSQERPMRFVEAALFQWINPKAWAMAISAMTTYTNPDFPWLSALIVSFVFGAVNFPCVSVWVIFGYALRRLLSNPFWLRFFNIFMAILLLISTLPLLFISE